MKRCYWVENAPQIYVDYHDNEWGVLKLDEKYLYMMLVLESFHAGLSWLIILKKREDFIAAFDNFDVNKVANYTEEKYDELMNNEKIVRSSLKIKATISNSKLFIEIQKEFGSFKNYLMTYFEKVVYVEPDATTSVFSDAISKDLKKRGFKFVGSVTVHSYLQAIGLINSHQKSCFLYKNEIEHGL